MENSVRMHDELGVQTTKYPENTKSNAELCQEPLSLQYLKTNGVDEERLDATISTVEFISDLIRNGKCVWKMQDKIKMPSKLERLKHASRNLLNNIYHNNNPRIEKRKMDARKRELIADQSGIRRLREEKGERLKHVFSGNPSSSSENPRLCHSVENSSEIVNVDPFVYPIAQECYICKSYFKKVHFFYDQMCPPCADLNFLKRSQSADLTGKVALVTGGRIKIGYEVVLKLLRCGIARVIVTTRFPQDAAKRYANEPDFHEWSDRLDIYGLDLRFLGCVEKFCAYVTKTYNRLDILIQNAAQTVRRPVAFYAHLLKEEANPTCLPAIPLVKTFSDIFLENNDKINTNNNDVVALTTPSLNSALASQLIVHPEDRSLKNDQLFPSGQYDEHHQQIDLRRTNSWLLETPQVETAELVEVSIVNSIAPFVILSKLTPLLKKCTRTSNDHGHGWIILVSAMEGKFNRVKTSRHPHTNCAKASLNMLVRTSSQYYARFGLLMNAVDTGWVTDEVPLVLRKQNEGRGAHKFFVPPLDEIDGAARILDPIFQTINCRVKEYGHFYKDYKSSDW